MKSDNMASVPKYGLVILLLLCGMNINGAFASENPIITLTSMDNRTRLSNTMQLMGVAYSFKNEQNSRVSLAGDEIESTVKFVVSKAGEQICNTSIEMKVKIEIKNDGSLSISNESGTLIKGDDGCTVLTRFSSKRAKSGSGFEITEWAIIAIGYGGDGSEFDDNKQYNTDNDVIVKKSKKWAAVLIRTGRFNVLLSK